jgi:hypothetical protein
VDCHFNPYNEIMTLRFRWFFAWLIPLVGSLSTCTGIVQVPTMAQQDYSTSNVRIARQQEEDFLYDLYLSLDMVEKPAVHNWFPPNSTNPDYCTFSGISCNSQKRITVLDLSSLGFSGTLPSNFLALSQLERLLLRNNDIGGRLPTKLPPKLIHLNLERNRLHGPLPMHLMEMEMKTPLLQRLILSDNILTGNIPFHLCQLTHLRALNIARNRDITGTLPACLGHMEDLEGLQIGYTSLVEPVPDSICPFDEMADGWCPRWDFCLGGFQQQATNATTTTICVPCPCETPSNVIASGTCAWIPSSSSAFLPSSKPSNDPSRYSSSRPSDTPSLLPSPSPSLLPSQSMIPSQLPSSSPSVAPTKSFVPSDAPSIVPSDAPSLVPSSIPSTRPSESTIPSWLPSAVPSATPSDSSAPSHVPSRLPSLQPSLTPSLVPSLLPFVMPSRWPSFHPTSPIMAAVTVDPSQEPSLSPSVGTGVHGVAGANTASQKSPSSSTKDDQFVAYLPVLVLVGCMVLAAFLLAIPNVLQRRRGRFFRVLPSSSDCIKSMDDISPPLPTQADSSLPSDSKMEKKLQDRTGGVTSRPCIVRPGTITADTKVRFLLLAKSQSGDGLEDVVDRSFSGEGSSVVTTMEEQQASTCRLAATVASIFRESGASTGHHEKGTDEEWMDTKPPSVYLSHDSSSSCKSLGDSSVSSTTPWLNLNLIIPKVGGSNEEEESPKPKRPRIQVLANSQDDFDSFELIARNLSTSSSNPCQLLSDLNLRKPQTLPSSSQAAAYRKTNDGFHSSLGRNRMRTMMMTMLDHRDDSPSPRAPYGYSRRSAVVDWPVLGIRSQTAAHGDDENAIEVFDFHDGANRPERRWLEVTDLEI